MEDQDERDDVIFAEDADGESFGVTFDPIEDSTNVRLRVYDSYGEPLVDVNVPPWELSAGTDLASKRPTRLPRLIDVPGAAETAPFDVVVGAILREEPPPMVTTESPERMSQRSRAARAMERGEYAFDLVLRLVVPGDVLAATTQVIGVPGNEITQTALYWTATLLRGAAEKLPAAQAAAASRGGISRGSDA